MNKIGVQKLFWDAFELALSTQTKRLARDIADALGQDAKPLLVALQAEKTGVYLFEESNTDDIEFLDMRCTHFTPIPGKEMYVAKCMEPVVWSANPAVRVRACLHHSLHPCVRNASWPILVPFLHEDATYYIDKAAEQVYNEGGELCGRLSGGRLILFEVESTD
jgi:hypothetical protein